MKSRYHNFIQAKRIIFFGTIILVILYVLILMRGKGTAMIEPVDEYMGYMWDNPPSCIKSLSTAADAQLSKLLIRDYGSYSTVFGVRCKCGNDTFSIIGKVGNVNYSGIVGPINIKCSVCNQKYLLFDPAKHGYEGALGLADYFDHNSEPDRKVKCPKCSKEVFKIAMCFQYDGEETRIIEEDGLKILPEDLFGWVAGYCRCSACGKEFEMTSIECQ